MKYHRHGSLALLVLFAQLVLFQFVTSAVANQATDSDDNEDSVANETLKLFHECGTGQFMLCLKERAFKYIQELPSNLDVDGLSIKQNEASRTGRQFNHVTLPDEPTAREHALNDILADRVLNYFSSHTFEFKLPNEALDDVSRSLEEARKKKKGKGGELLGLIKLKLMAIGGILLKLVALVAFKALIVAKIALLLALAIAIKKLLDSKQQTSTYEVITHPHYEDYHHHDRAFAQERAYRAHIPAV